MNLQSVLIQKVADVYNWIDRQISENLSLAGQCQVCGKCCDFDAFEHKLFLTSLELKYLATKLGSANVRQMSTGLCPYNSNGKCEIHDDRFAGCRIFCCKGDKDFQSHLSESALSKFKILCAELKVPYRYTELSGALNNF